MNPTPPPAAGLDAIAPEYVRLVLAMGLHDEDYVDAYYGPPSIRAEVEKERPGLEQIHARASALLSRLEAMPRPDGTGQDMLDLRQTYLQKQLLALVTRARILRGETISFDEQARLLYDAEPPHKSEAEFQEVIDRLDRRLPGEGPVLQRFEEFRDRFIIPSDRLDEVFRLAIEACRARTLEHIDLPPSESFRLEYVKDKSWSGYNWYQGNYQSLIQLNTDLPIYIDRAIDLACHEGYPGHHVYNLLLEKNMVNDRGWIEYSVYPLFSPQSLIAEGTANYGIDVAFPADQRVAFEKQTLFPAAGLDSVDADEYYEIQELVQQLGYAGNEAARRYINGEIDAAQAAEWLIRYGLYSPDRARQRVRFMDQYGAYVINYNLGKDLVRRHVEALGGTSGNPARRWEIFEDLLSSPRLPSGLSR